MLKNILVPTDGFGLEDDVIHFVAESFPEANFYVISVVSASQRGVHLTTLMKDVLQKSAREAIEHAVDILSSYGASVIKTDVLSGIPSRCIIKYAKENRINLIAFRTYAKAGIQSLRLGSTIENTLKGTKIPVLIMATKKKGETPKKMLVATDGTHSSQNAENYAIYLSLYFKAKLSAIYVARKEGMKEYGARVLENFVWKAQQFGIEAEPIFASGEPEDEIIKLAGKYHLVIMGSGRRGFLGSHVIGHVAREVAAVSPTPVIFVRYRLEKLGKRA